MRLVALIGVLLIVILVLAAVVAPAGAASGARPFQTLAGGGVAVPEELPLPAGGTFDGLFPLVVTNPNPVPVTVRIQEQAPPGISISPAQRVATVAPSGSVSIPYSVRIDASIAAGTYPIEVAAVPEAGLVDGEGIRFVNAIVQRYKIVVGGAAGDLKARAVDTIDNRPVEGVFTASLLSGVAPVPVARGEGTSFSARLVPGDYELAFELDGVRIASRTVSVLKGKTTNAQLEVSLLQFTEVEATRIEADGELVAVELGAQFDNRLRPISNLTFTLDVTRNGRATDQIEVQRFEALAPGRGSVSTRYVPDAGWRNGTYEFRFRMVADGVSVAAREPLVIQVGPSAGASRWWIAAAGALFVVLLVAAGVVVLARRHRGGDPDAGSRNNRTDSLPSEAVAAPTGRPRRDRVGSNARPPH